MSVKDTQHFKKLDQEIEELESMLRGKSSIPPEGITAPIEEVPEVVEEIEVPVSEGFEEVEMAPVSEEEEDSGSKRTAWKQEYLNLEKRYKKLRSTTDMKLYQLRTEKGDLLNTIRSLENQVDSLSSRLATLSAPKEMDILSTFSSDEIDLMGGPETVESTVKVANKLMEQKVKPIEEELKRTKEEHRKKLAKLEEEEKLNAYNSFMARLGDAVPDYESINKNPEFLKWLEGYDPESAYSRLERLRNAQGRGDVPMVASLFTRWVDEKTNKINPALEKKIGVSSSQGMTINTQRGKVEIIPYSIVKKFYDDDAKGRYRSNPKKADELERKYDLARLQGRIDFRR